VKRPDELESLAALDLRAAETLAGHGEEFAPVVLFHAQQAAEKWLKAALRAKDLETPRTHSLSALVDLLAKELPEADALRDDAEFLTPFAVAPRYVLRPITEPGLSEQALEAARRVRETLEPHLERPDDTSDE